MRRDDYGDLLERCKGVGIRNVYHAETELTELYLTGELKVPSNVYVKATATSCKGTIGRVIDIEPDLYGDEKISSWNGIIIMEIDGRPKPSRISSAHCDLLPFYTGPTQWVRTIKAKEHEEIEPHVNKYGQTINIGDWIVGQMAKKKIAFGQVTRYSKSSVWVAIPQKERKPKEFCINNPKESFALPPLDGEQYEQYSMMMVLGGWNGEQK